MKVFVRQVPADTTGEELHRFFEPYVSRRWYSPFRNVGHIVDCQVVAIRDTVLDRKETHGLVEIEPGNVALRAILSTNGLRIRKQVVEVRRWFDRSPANDRRFNEVARKARGVERRSNDRRRSGLEMCVVNAI